MAQQSEYNFEEADAIAQGIVDTTGSLHDAEIEPNPEYKILFHKACDYRQVRQKANHYRQQNGLTPEVEEEEKQTLVALIQARKKYDALRNSESQR